MTFHPNSFLSLEDENSATSGLEPAFEQQNTHGDGYYEEQHKLPRLHESLLIGEK